LRLLAQRLVSLGSCVALLASRAEKTHLVFAQSEGLGLDLGSLLRRALDPLGGRGGGRGNLVQGGSDRGEGVETVLAGLAAELRSQPTPHP
jgi:alanyl-tRNA synthetase